MTFDASQKQPYCCKRLSTNFVSLCSGVGYVDGTMWEGWSKIWNLTQMALHNYASYQKLPERCQTVSTCFLLWKILDSFNPGENNATQISGDLSEKPYTKDLTVSNSSFMYYKKPGAWDSYFFQCKKIVTWVYFSRTVVKGHLVSEFHELFSGGPCHSSGG
jgi:hypothetical protein